MPKGLYFAKIVTMIGTSLRPHGLGWNDKPALLTILDDGISCGHQIVPDIANMLSGHKNKFLVAFNLASNKSLIPQHTVLLRYM